MRLEDRERATLIVGLLKETHSLDILKKFLKSKQVPSTATWDEILELRIIPALQENKFTVDELQLLLRDTEENGRQHIFVYKTTPQKALTLISEQHIRTILEDMGISDLLDAPKILEKPDVATFVEVRWEKMGISPHASAANSLVIKIIETRTVKHKIPLNVEGLTEAWTFEYVKERAVNLIRLSSDGLLEIKIGSKSNSNEYRNELNAVWGMVNKIIPMEDFIALSLSTAKKNIWDKRDTFKEIYRFVASTLRNVYGVTVRAAVGSEDKSLASNVGATSCLNTFLGHDGHCDTNDVLFIGKENSTPSKDIRVKIGGANNEFALTTHCNKIDYEYVLSKLRSLN